jgi:hypothetical protein
MLPSTRSRVLELAAAYAALEPSLLGAGPWRIELEPERLLLRAARPAGRAGVDPRDRALVQGAGAALLHARVAVAEGGWAADVERLPCPDDPELLALVRPCVGTADPVLAALAPVVTHHGTDRRRFAGPRLPDAVLSRLTEIAESEGVLLIPVVDDAHLQLIDGLTPERRAGDQQMVLLATRTDDPVAWLHVGEALEHVLLELGRLGWAAGPVTQAHDVPLARTRLQGALTWSAHPQTLLRIGQAPATPASARLRRPRTGQLPRPREAGDAVGIRRGSDGLSGRP